MVDARATSRRRLPIAITLSVIEAEIGWDSVRERVAGKAMETCRFATRAPARAAVA